MEKDKKEKSSALFPTAMPPASTAAKQLIAIGASTGGTEAIATILKDLTPPLPPIVIVQHIPPVFSNHFAHRLNAISALTVKEAENGETIFPSTACAPPPTSSSSPSPSSSAPPPSASSSRAWARTARRGSSRCGARAP